MAFQAYYYYNDNKLIIRKDIKMKKILMLATAAFIFQATPALAEHHEGGDHKGKRHMEKMKKSDSDGNGSISEAEFMAKAKEKFAEKDTNGDGEISQDEAKAAHEAKRSKMKEKRGEMKAKRGEMKKKADEAIVAPVESITAE